MNQFTESELRKFIALRSAEEENLSRNIKQLRAIHQECFSYEYLCGIENDIFNKIKELRELLKETRFNLHVNQLRLQKLLTDQGVTFKC